VTTLWRVPDAPTAELMRVFYAGVQAGLPVDRALAEAKRALQASGALAHPHYWAAFVLTGPGEPLPKALRWRDVAGETLVAVGVLAMARLLWMRRRDRTAA